MKRLQELLQLNEQAKADKCSIIEQKDKAWFGPDDRKAWEKAVAKLSVDDDGENFAKLDGKLIAKWYPDRNEGWVLTESKNHMGETEYTSFVSWKSALKKKFPSYWLDGDKEIANAMVGPKPFKRGETKSVGEWDGDVGVIYQNVSEGKMVKQTAADASAHYEKMKRMFDAGNPGVTQRMLDGLKANADSMWDTELKAREKSIIGAHGSEWYELVQKQYPIEQRDKEWVVTSKVKSWADDKEWKFDYKAQAVEKRQQLIRWLQQGRKRGFGDEEADIEKWVAKLNAVDKAK